MLCSGSRRGLERHHTLRHAVAWSYDLLDDGKRMLLDRCAVFAGGFDSKVPAPWPDSTMPTTTPYWISWTLWCVAEEQLVARGEEDQVRTAAGSPTT
jgi:hypothetical protein